MTFQDTSGQAAAGGQQRRNSADAGRANVNAARGLSAAGAAGRIEGAERATNLKEIKEKEEKIARGMSNANMNANASEGKGANDDGMEEDNANEPELDVSTIIQVDSQISVEDLT